MKKLFLIFSIFVLSLSFTQAQWTSGYSPLKKTLQNGFYLDFGLTVDSVTEYTSSVFSLDQYDNQSFYTYPLTVAFKQNSVLGTPYVTAIIQGSFDNSNWLTIDTLMYKDSTEIATKKTIDMNGYKFPLYRMFINGDTTTGVNVANRSDTVLRLWVYAYFKD